MCSPPIICRTSLVFGRKKGQERNERNAQFDFCNMTSFIGRNDNFMIVMKSWTWPVTSNMHINNCARKKHFVKFSGNPIKSLSHGSDPIECLWFFYEGGAFWQLNSYKVVRQQRNYCNIVFIEFVLFSLKNKLYWFYEASWLG